MKFDGRNEAVQALSSMLSSRAVQIQTPQSSQQSAAEEVGMLFSQKVESSSKELSQRKLRTLDTQVQRIQGIEQLNELYEQLGHPGQLSLGQLARQVRHWRLIILAICMRKAAPVNYCGWTRRTGRPRVQGRSPGRR